MSIVEVSKLSGVSIATVSRVINRHPHVADNTAMRVEAAMSKLGYVPPREKRAGRPRRAQDLARGAGSVALLFVDARQASLRTALSMRLVHAIEDALWRRSLAMTLIRLPLSGQWPAQLHSRLVDGVIVRNVAGLQASPTPPPSLPCVHLFEPEVIPPTGDMILEDNPLIGAMAADHLVEKGHKELIYVNPLPTHPAFRTRGVAFQAAAQRHGARVETIEAALLPSRDRLAAGDKVDVGPLVERICKRKKGPVGIFAPGRDSEVVDLCAGLKDRGFRIGQDMDLVCCHNAPDALAHSAAPQASVIDICPEVMAEAAVDTLLWRIANPNEPRRRFMTAPAPCKRADAEQMVTSRRTGD